MQNDLPAVRWVGGPEIEVGRRNMQIVVSLTASSSPLRPTAASCLGSKTSRRRSWDERDLCGR